MSYTKERFTMDPQSDVVPIKPPGSHSVGGDAAAIADKAIAVMIDPIAEDMYWRKNYPHRPYANANSSYDEYGPAYRYGVDAFGRSAQRSFDEAEAGLSRDWNSARGTSSLDWDRARHAARDAWNRLRDAVEHALPGDGGREAS